MQYSFVWAIETRRFEREWSLDPQWALARPDIWARISGFRISGTLQRSLVRAATSSSRFTALARKCGQSNQDQLAYNRFGVQPPLRFGDRQIIAAFVSGNSGRRRPSIPGFGDDTPRTARIHLFREQMVAQGWRINPRIHGLPSPVLESANFPVP